MPRDINELKARLGNDIPWSSRLTEALTHRSYAVENSLSYDNQRLEFLGDAVLEIVLTDYLFRLYPDCDEGAMTKIRSALVREPALARLARKLELGEYLLVGRGEKESGGAGAIRRWPISLRRCSERSTSMPDSRRSKNSSPGCSRRNTRTRRSLLHTINPKGLLQEYSQARWGQPPVYTVLRTTGPEHQPVYEVEVSLRGYVAFGRAASRKQAESSAAHVLYLYLTEHEANV